MTLSFSQHIKTQPTFFLEKIFKQLSNQLGEELDSYIVPTFKKLGYKNPLEFINKIVAVKPKLHTIRKDTSNRWKAGNAIHPVINNRTPDRFQFAPVIPCISTQTIIIKHFYDVSEVLIDQEKLLTVHHRGLSKLIKYDLELQTLAINDGFSSVEDFFKYFNTDYEGKIIHWTDLTY